MNTIALTRTKKITFKRRLKILKRKLRFSIKLKIDLDNFSALKGVWENK